MTGRPTREFLYVEDAAEGIVLAAERYNASDPVNLGSGRRDQHPRPGGDDRQLTGFDGRLRVGHEPSPTGSHGATLDTAKAEALFGFRARTTFEEGLRKTVDWFLANQDRLSGRAPA